MVTRRIGLTEMFLLDFELNDQLEGTLLIFKELCMQFFSVQHFHPREIIMLGKGGFFERQIP